MKYISISADLNADINAIAVEICSIALGRTVNGRQLGDRHNVYNVGGNEMEFITNIVPIYSSKSFTPKDIIALTAAVNLILKQVDFTDYRDPIGLFNSTDNLIMTCDNTNWTLSVTNKADGVFNNCTARICVYIADLIYLNSATITNYGPTCIVYDTESILAYPSGYRQINIPKLADFKMGRSVLPRVTKFTAIAGLYQAIEDIYNRGEKTRMYPDSYDYLVYKNILSVDFKSLNYLHSTQTLSEKIHNRIFNSGAKITMEQIRQRKVCPPKMISGADLIAANNLTCFITGAPIYEHCYVLDVYAWTEIFYINPNQISPDQTYEPHLSPSCAAAEAEFKNPMPERDGISQTATVMRFKRNDENVYLYKSFKHNAQIAVSALVPLVEPVHIVVSPMYKYTAHLLSEYGIHAIMYKSWYPRLAYDVIEHAPISKEERDVLHLLNGPVKMEPEAIYGYYLVAGDTEFRTAIQTRHLKKKVQLYTSEIYAGQLPDIIDMEPDTREKIAV
jgi:hypothetical protein